ncbi:MAG TPA: hypothetical protein VJ847_10315 [Gemmatimonadales bacterium]|jgi:hypothetical protein|nr:hypothetical protein [Gemmatimonadales bacterium]
MHRSLTRLTRAAAAVAGVVAVASCSSDSNGPNGNVKDYFSAVQAVVTTAAAPIAPTSAFRPSIGTKTKATRPLFSAMPPQTISGSYHGGTPQTASDGPSIANAQGSTAFLGQPFRYSITGSTGFSKVYLWVDGADGYFELDLPASVTVLDLILQMTENAGSSFDLETAVSGSGGVGPAHSETVAPTDPATADVFVTLQWHNTSDVDLHVTDGNGFVVYFAQPASPEGGKLDLDANAGCETTNATNPQETISWPHGTAPSGPYTVSVVYYDDCGEPSTTYTGTITVNGQTKTFTGGTFTGSAANATEQQAGTFTIP